MFTKHSDAEMERIIKERADRRIAVAMGVITSECVAIRLEAIKEVADAWKNALAAVHSTTDGLVKEGMEPMRAAHMAIDVTHGHICAADRIALAMHQKLSATVQI